MNDRFILSGPEFKYPLQKTSLGKYFFEYADKNSDRICQIDGIADKFETYSSVKLRTTRLATALQQRQVSQNDVITLCCSNSLDTIIPIIAAFYLGMKVSNLEPSLSVRHTKYLLGLVTPKIIFVEESSLKLIEDSLLDAKFVPEIIVFEGSEKYTSFSDLTKPHINDSGFRPTEINADDVAVMFFSSGTTGLPKAICHSHYSLLMAANQMYCVGTQEAILHFSSFYWISAMLLLICSYRSGTYRVFCREFTTKDVFAMIEKYKVAYIFTAPVLTYNLTSFPNASSYNISSLKIIFCDGTTMPAFQLQKMSNLFKSVFISLLYRTSQAGLCTVFDPEYHQNLAKQKLCSCGKVAPEMQLKVCDLDTGKSLPAYQKGEVRLKSSFLMKGYYATDSSDTFDDEGFSRTGDIGYYDEHGCVYVMGSTKEMFKYRSWYITPSLIEAALLEYPGIKEAVVVGVECGKDGEAPAAAVVVKNGSTVSEEGIDNFLKERVATIEKLRGCVVFMESLPKTPTGRVKRKEIKETIMKTLEKNKVKFL